MPIRVLHKGTTILDIGWSGFEPGEGEEVHELDITALPELPAIGLSWEYRSSMNTIWPREKALTRGEYIELVRGLPKPDETKPIAEVRIAELEAQVVAMRAEIDTLKGGVAEMMAEKVAEPMA